MVRFQNETISFSALAVIRKSYGFVLSEFADVRSYKPSKLRPTQGFSV